MSNTVRNVSRKEVKPWHMQKLQEDSITKKTMTRDQIVRTATGGIAENRAGLLYSFAIIFFLKWDASGTSLVGECEV